MSGAGVFDPVVGQHSTPRGATIIGNPAALARDWKRMREYIVARLDHLQACNLDTSNLQQLLSTLECKEHA